MDAGTAPGLHLLAEQAIALCALAALALGGLVAGGFALLWHSERGAGRVADQAGLGPRELGLLAIWRLQRALRSGPAKSPLPSSGRADSTQAARPVDTSM